MTKIKTKIPLLLLLFFAFSFLYRSDSSFDQDLGRHIKSGEIIWTSLSVPGTNLFSYTYPDFPFINHHWLFEVLIYLWQIHLPLLLFLILKIVIILASVALILVSLPEKFYPLLLPTGFIFLHILRERIELRPEIFSFLFTASALYILQKFLKRGGKLIFLLPFIQLIWVNTHIYFPLGIFLEAAFLVSLLVKKDWSKFKLLGIVTLVSILISFVNPNGVSGALYPFKVFSNYGYTIAENQNIFLLESLNFRDPNFLFVKISALLIFLSWVVAYFRRNVSLIDFILPVIGLTLSTLNIRSFPYLIFLSLPSVVRNFGPLKWRFWTIGLSTLAGVLLLIESTLYLSGDYYKYTDSPYSPDLKLVEQGKSALDFVLSNNLPQPIFNNFDIGSYIEYRAFPKIRVFIDGRPEAYPADFFEKTYIPSQEDYQKFQALDKKYQFKTVIFSITDQTPWADSFLTAVVKDSSWQAVYLDNFMIVLVKKNEALQRNLASVDLKNLSPDQYHFSNHFSYIQISLFLLNTGNIEAGGAFAKKALDIFPQSPEANLIMANILSSKGDPLSLTLARDYYLKSNGSYFW